MDAFTTCIFLCFLLPVLAIYIQQSWPRLLKSLPPSPSLALPVIGHIHLLGRMPHQSLQALARKHGSIMFLWLGTVPLVVVSSASTAKEVLKSHDLTFASRPYLTVGEEVGYKFMGMALVEYGDHWKNIRKLLTLELFTAKRTDSFLWIRVEEVSHMLSAVVKAHEKGRSLDMRNLLTTFTFNITTRILMSKRYFCHDGDDGEDADSGEARLFKDVVYDISKIVLQFHISEFVPPFLRWIDWSVYRMRKLHAKQDKFLQKIVDEHKDKRPGSSKGDFVDIMLEVLREHPRRDDVIKALQELVTGGTETSATTLEWAFAEVLYNAPEVLKRAQEELEMVVGTSRLVDESDLPKLTYLQAVVKEVFRLHPPGPLLAPHLSMEACTIAGYHVPKGSTTFVNVYAIGRDPALWDEPLEFRPERFLGSTMDVKGQDFELIPFGSGRRQCPGMGLGLKTVQLALANLMHGFDWKAVKDRASLEEGFGSVIWLKKPLIAMASPKLPLQVLTK